MQLAAFNTVCSLRVFSKGTALNCGSVTHRVLQVFLQLNGQDFILILGHLLAGK